MGCASSAPAVNEAAGDDAATRKDDAAPRPGPAPGATVQEQPSADSVSPSPMYTGRTDTGDAVGTPATGSGRMKAIESGRRSSQGGESDKWDEMETDSKLGDPAAHDPPEAPADEACTAAAAMAEVEQAAVNSCGAAAQSKRAAQKQASGAAGKSFKKSGSPSACKETTKLHIEKVKGYVFVNQYMVVKFLGSGACGKVFLCLNTHDLRLYAMKVVGKAGLQASSSSQGKARHPMEDLKRKIMIMRMMKHQNIVTLSEVIDNPNGSKLLLIMEFMDGGPLLTREALEKRQRIPESVARGYFRDMLKALDYLHAHKIVHGDLKPENVLMSVDGDVKLSDFGCSKTFVTNNEYLDRCNGTPGFLAPEMMKPNTRYRGRPTDMYALGACLYTLIYGRIPFSAPNVYKLFQVVQRDPVRYPPEVPVSFELMHLLDSMLTKNPAERIVLSDCMKHPWTTLGGRFPLKGWRDLKPGESNEQHDGLPGGVTFAEANPKLSMIHKLEALGVQQRHFYPGDVIIRQRDHGVVMLYILSGTAEVIVKHTPPVPWQRSASSGQPRAGNGQPAATSGAPSTPGASPGPAPGSSGGEFGADSDSMSPIVDQESLDNRVKLMRVARKARDVIDRLKEVAAGDGPLKNDMVVAQRGAGELIGDMALFSKTGLRCATVRCATPLVAKVVMKNHLDVFLAKNPLIKLQVLEGVTKKESELTIVEALVRLVNLHDIILASLEPFMCEDADGKMTFVTLPPAASDAAATARLDNSSGAIDPLQTPPSNLTVVGGAAAGSAAPLAVAPARDVHATPNRPASR